MTDAPHAFSGPILIVDDVSPRGEAARLHLAALVLGGDGAAPPPLVAEGAEHGFDLLATPADGLPVWRARFDLPADRDAGYAWAGTDYPVASDLTGDLRIAYVSCNGEEHGDLDRPEAERNVMWARLGREHARAPFSLLLHGGDQIYADEVTDDHPASHGWPFDLPETVDADTLDGLRGHLRSRLARRYATLYGQRDIGWLMARVPSLMQWDDHDICDGWGSLPPEVTQHPTGQLLFAEARAATLLFQHACTDGDLPARFDDPAGEHIGWTVQLPGLRLVAPDLRTGRTMTQVMASDGWAAMEAATEATDPAMGRTMILSSVPLLGPRLSLVERLMRRLPGVQKYEDDLRDQWQSAAHRDSWRRMLRLVRRMDEKGSGVTVLSGEIHLATRAEMALGDGHVLHQLVASGVTHRAPPAVWARVLGTLALLGEDPLPDAPITIRPLPGQRHRYTAERNAMVLARRADGWQARWMLEHTGTTPPLALGT